MIESGWENMHTGRLDAKPQRPDTTKLQDVCSGILFFLEGNRSLTGVVIKNPAKRTRATHIRAEDRKGEN